MSQNCKHFNTMGHEGGCWCVGCGAQVRAYTPVEIARIANPLVIAADQLAQDYEKAAKLIHNGQYHGWKERIYFQSLLPHGNEFEQCGERNCIEARKALAAYRKAREGE